MARIRTVKPEFFLDTDLSELPIEARYLFIGLWTQADRAGRLEDNAKRLKAQLLPWDSCDTGAMLSALSPKFITRYEAAGRRYIQINTFEKHQRPHIREAESVIPAPSGSDEAQPRKCQSTAKAMTSPLDKGKGKEGNGEGSMEPEGFTAFWTVYPRKEAKADALKAWGKLKPDQSLQARILSAVESHKKREAWRKDQGKFIPLPATWLNSKRWEDEVSPMATTAPMQSSRDRTAAFLAAQGAAQ